MSKLIKVTKEYLDEVRKDFEEALSSGKFSDGKITFTKTIGSINRKATVFFTDMAWNKMQTLIREFDKEVAWHGLAFRGDDETKDEYIIKDILVYPQEVTGATVNTDQEKYQTWLMENEDDVFNNIRMQGHSHVNMGTTPSGVDTSLYDRILEQLDDDMFYIFMIWNKRGEKTIKIYDMKKNILFETADCTVEVMDDGYGISKFLKSAKEMVKDKVTSHNKPSTTGSSYGGYGYNGGSYYGSSYYGSHGVSQYQSQKEDKKEEPKKKKGKRKGHKGGVNNACDEDKSQMTMFGSARNGGLYGDDDDDDIYGSFYSRGW